MALVGFSLALAWSSDRFAPEVVWIDRDPVLLVALLIAAGLFYTALLVRLPRVRPLPALLAAALLAGLVMRLALLGSTPALEDDYQRYLWDGGVTAAGTNPYAIAPAEAERLLPELVEASGGVNHKVNHPDLRTIYPPVAQAFFAAAHWLGPWSLEAWRLVLLACDLATLALLLALLRQLGRSPLWALIYWWNPLVVKELFNSAHMDALLLPFLLAGLLLLLRGRGLWATASLVLAAGVKLWPLLLLPLAWRRLWPDRRDLVLSLGLVLGGVCLLISPLLITGLDQSSGLLAYSRTWAINDAFFLSLDALVATLLGPAGIDSGAVARGLIATGLVALSLYFASRSQMDDEDVVTGFTILTATLFLTSPAQFPWYYAWLVPFLALRPNLALLLPTVLLPLYYLRFPLEAAGRPGLFDHGVVWLEWLPVWSLLALGWLRRGRAQLIEKVRAEAA